MGHPMANIHERPDAAPESWAACRWNGSEEPHSYRALASDGALPHELGIDLEESKACPDDLSEWNGGGQLCGPRPSKTRIPARSEALENLPKLTVASVASSEHLPTHTLQHHVRYEIGEHPMADILVLTGGGRAGIPVIVGALVPGGKAEQAGVSMGDELVAVSGRPDFYLTPAARLLESLPTPTLLVFLKESAVCRSRSREAADPNAAIKNDSESDRTIRQALAFSSLPSSDESTAERIHEVSEVSDSHHTPARLDFAIGRIEPSLTPARARGASWESSPPVLAEKSKAGLGEDVRASLSARSAAGISRYNTEPPPTTESDQPKVASQVAIIHRDKQTAGLPTGQTLFGPNVQVELCDQVVFNAKATLIMQGTTPRTQSLKDELEPWPPFAGEFMHGHSSKSKATPQSWMYELPRREARRLVECVRREAKQAERESSRASSSRMCSRESSRIQEMPCTVGDSPHFFDTSALTQEANSIDAEANMLPEGFASKIASSHAVQQPRHLQFLDSSLKDTSNALSERTLEPSAVFQI